MSGYDDFPDDVKRYLGILFEKYGFDFITSETYSVILANGKCQILLQPDYQYVSFLVRRNKTEHWVPPGSVLKIRKGENIDQVFPSIEHTTQSSMNRLDSLSSRDLIKASLQDLANLISKGDFESFFDGDFSKSDIFLEWLEIKNTEQND